MLKRNSRSCKIVSKMSKIVDMPWRYLVSAGASAKIHEAVSSIEYQMKKPCIGYNFSPAMNGEQILVTVCFN